MKAKKFNTASLAPDLYCKDCGWPVLSCCCNDEMSDLHPDSDWWRYCSNQGCRNHSGSDFGVNGLDGDWTFIDNNLTNTSNI